jgi:polysaccharide biosynthesis/export protein
MRLLMSLCIGFGLWLGVSSADAQTLKVGDSLSITVMQDPKLDRSVVVDPLGEIAFPLAGHIKARGLTPLALEHVLKSKLQNNYKDEALDITVAIANAPKDVPEEDLKPKFYVTGEVIKPGSYIIRQPISLMQGIALAGGMGPFAAKRRIQVRRRTPNANETVFTFDYRAYEDGKDVDANIMLRAGDVIMVPERGLFD